MGAGDLRQALVAGGLQEFDVDGAAGRSMAFEALDQLAMEHLPGVS
ncbi:hypothetical protein [Streptomyces sp. NPDC058382]